MSLLRLFCLSSFLLNFVSTSSAECKIVKYPRSLFKNEKRLHGFQFNHSTSVPNAFHCARMCFFRRRCLSFNYNKERSLCEFNNARFDPPYVLLNPSSSFLYSDIDDWDEVIGTGACQNHPCGICEVCQPTATGYTCVSEELTSCRDIKICNNASSDGTYKLKPLKGTKPPIEVYCHKMNSKYPREYITLPHENYSRFPPYQGSCSNVNWTMNNTGVIYYRKIRLELDTLRVIVTDRTFTNISCNPNDVGISDQQSFESSGRNCSVELDYGSTSACIQTDCNNYYAIIRLNLRGTGLTIPSSMKWEVTGEKTGISTHRILGILTIICKGKCASCQPKQDLILEVNP